MCQTRFEIVDNHLSDEGDYDDGFVKTFWYPNKDKSGREDALAKAALYAKDYSKIHPGRRIWLSDWYCGGPCGTDMHFEDGHLIPEMPSVGYKDRKSFGYGKEAQKLPDRYTFGNKMMGSIIGKKQTQQRDVLLNMINQIQAVVKTHEDTCECEMCTIFTAYIRDDKAKIDAELRGYRLYTARDARELDDTVRELQSKVESHRAWLKWMVENFESLKVEGLAKEAQEKLTKLLDITRDDTGAQKVLQASEEEELDDEF